VSLRLLYSRFLTLSLLIVLGALGGCGGGGSSGSHKVTVKATYAGDTNYATSTGSVVVTVP